MSSSEPRIVGRRIACASVIGFSTRRPSRRRSPAGQPQPVEQRRRRRTTSRRPRAARGPTSASSARRRSRWAAVSRPGTPVRFSWIVAGRSSNPSIRATSSIRSASRVTSVRRQCGTLTSRPSPASATPKPSAREDLRAALARRSAAPSSAATRASRRRTTAGRRPGTADVDRPGPGVAPHSSIISARGDGLRLERLLGRQALLEAGAGLAAQAEPPRGAVDVRPVPGRDLHQHAGRAVVRPRSARRPSRRRSTSARRRRRSRTTSGSRTCSTSSSVVIRSPSAARRTTRCAARDAVEVEGVQRLAGQQHHVVRDVDDGVDRAAGPAAISRAFSHHGDGPIVTFSKARAVKRGHELGAPRRRSDAGDRVAGGVRVAAPTAAGRAARRWPRGPRARRRRRPRQSGRLGVTSSSRTSVAIGRSCSSGAPGRSRRRAGGVEHHDAGVLGADRDLVLGQDHALPTDAAQLGGLRAGSRRA